MRNTILRKPTDAIPYSFDLTWRIMEKLANHFQCGPWDVYKQIGDYFLWFGPQQVVPKNPAPGTRVDEFGAVYRLDGVTNEVGDWSEPIQYALSEPDFDEYQFPSANKIERFPHLDRASMEVEERYLICGITGLFDRGWHLCGFENFMMYMLSDPDFTSKALDKSLEYNLGIIEQMPDWADGIRFGEDWGQQQGMLMGSRLWRGQLKPRLKIMYETAAKRGFDVFIHSCGNIKEIIPDLIEIGVQVINPVQPEVMDIAFLKKEYGQDLVFYGGLPCQSIIPYGTVEQNREAAKKAVDILGAGGGYIYGPAGAVPTDAPVENVLEIIDFIQTKNRCRQ